MLEKYIFLQKFSWYLPKNGQFYDQIWLSNTIEYWGRIRFSVEYIQFWKVGFEWRQNSRIFVEYAVFEYSGTPLLDMINVEPNWLFRKIVLYIIMITYFVAINHVFHRHSCRLYNWLFKAYMCTYRYY